MKFAAKACWISSHSLFFFHSKRFFFFTVFDILYTRFPIWLGDLSITVFTSSIVSKDSIRDLICSFRPGEQEVHCNWLRYKYNSFGLTFRWPFFVLSKSIRRPLRRVYLPCGFYRSGIPAIIRINNVWRTTCRTLKF